MWVVCKTENEHKSRIKIVSGNKILKVINLDGTIARGGISSFEHFVRVSLTDG